MKKHLSKILTLCLALCMVCAMSVNAFAAEIGTSGGSGTTPVNLTTTNGGIGGGGDTTPTKLNVVVPTSLPMAYVQFYANIKYDGNVVTATDCKITNNFGDTACWVMVHVRVKSVSITAASDWHLTSFGSKSSLAGEKVDSNKLGFAMSIGGGQQVKTSGNAATQALITAPITGCYMTGAGDVSGNTVAIDYSAIVTPLSGAVNNATVASVVFVIEWDVAD